ncbi:hypothetical protein [Nonomuraea sp. NPDC002799]
MTDLYQSITPHTHPERWTEVEKKLFGQGKCCWLIESGTVQNVYCTEESKQGASFGHCIEHADQFLEDFYPNGTPRP